VRPDEPAATPDAAQVLTRRPALPPGGVGTQTGAGRLTLVADHGVGTLPLPLSRSRRLTDSQSPIWACTSPRSRRRPRADQRRGGSAVTATDAAGSYPVARDGTLIAGRYLLRMKNPGRLIYPLVQSLVLLAPFVSVLGNLAITRHAGGGSYCQFLIPASSSRTRRSQRQPPASPCPGMPAAAWLTGSARCPCPAPPCSSGGWPPTRSSSRCRQPCCSAWPRCSGSRSVPGCPTRPGSPQWRSRSAFPSRRPWLALKIQNAETAERVLFLPSIAIAFISSAFAPVCILADLALLYSEC
jgi:hypothetical protein